MQHLANFATMRRLAIVFLALAFSGPAGAIESWIDADDRAWLAAHPEIPFSYDPQWVPFSYRNDAGQLMGLDADVLRLLGSRLKVEFKPVSAADWSDAYQRAQNREAFFLTGTARTPEREADFLSTRPYVSFPIAIIAREEARSIDDISLLIDQRVAAPRDYAPTLALRRDFPEIDLVDCANLPEALRLLAAGKADAVLSNLVSASHIIRNEGLTGLKVSGVGPYSFQLRFAVRRDLPELHRALDAAIASLNSAERQELIAPYVPVDTRDIMSRRSATRWFLIGGAFACVAIAAIAWHNHRLRQELELRRRLQSELEASRDSLARLNEEKTGLMRMAAHDLRSPLTGLILSLDLLQMDDPATRANAIERVRTQVDRMNHLIHNLLDMEAIESGTRHLHSERILIDTAIPESLAAFEASARRKSIRLAYAASVPGLAVFADRSALRQICDNLVSNAVKYSPPGTAVHIAAARSPDGRSVRLCVRDEGPGIRPDEMGRLFEKYTCLSARPTAGETSTGLGLSIVKELVVRLGGRVWCESQVGRGATFFVELPAAELPPPLLL